MKKKSYKNRKIMSEIGNLLTDKTAGLLEKNKQLENQGEYFGSLVTLTYLQKKICPLMNQLNLE